MSCCPQCDKWAVKTRVIDHSFTYGIGKDAVVLEVRAPLLSCAACGLDFFDHETETIKEQAVREHLEGADGA